MKLGVINVARYTILSVTTIGIIVVCIFLFNLLGPEDSLGEANHDCARLDFPSVPNGAGMTATAHTVACSYGFAHETPTTFVYVHKSQEEDNRKTLVFRFDNESAYEPKMTWDNSSELHISIPQVWDISKQVDSVDNIKIAYSIGKVDFSPQESSRLVRRYAEILFASLAFLIAVFLLTVRSLRRVTSRTT